MTVRLKPVFDPLTFSPRSREIIKWMDDHGIQYRDTECFDHDQQFPYIEITFEKSEDEAWFKLRWQEYIL